MTRRRINECFAALKAQGRKGLVTFIMGGDPGVEESLALLKKLPQAGADIIEIGIPFSDPMADGPVIQAAGQRALAAKTKLRDILRITQSFRQENNTTPIVLMGYYNPVYRYGPETFCKDAAKAGVDGLILVDLPPEEEAELRPFAEAAGVAFIRLLAPTSLENRLPKLLRETQGFVYYISVAGVTGAKSADLNALPEQISQIRKHTHLPVAVGFGIKTPEQAKDTARHADAVVVGSALVDIFHREGEEAALKLVRELRSAL